MQRTFSVAVQRLMTFRFATGWTSAYLRRCHSASTTVLAIVLFCFTGSINAAEIENWPFRMNRRKWLNSLIGPRRRGGGGRVTWQEIIFASDEIIWSWKSTARKTTRFYGLWPSERNIYSSPEYMRVVVLINCYSCKDEELMVVIMRGVEGPERIGKSTGTSRLIIRTSGISHGNTYIHEEWL